jgi:hypothetical protein
MRIRGDFMGSSIVKIVNQCARGLLEVGLGKRQFSDYISLLRKQMSQYQGYHKGNYKVIDILLKLEAELEQEYYDGAYLRKLNTWAGPLAEGFSYKEHYALLRSHLRFVTHQNAQALNSLEQTLRREEENLKESGIPDKHIPGKIEEYLLMNYPSFHQYKLTA